jgi:PAS domain S-box-containing protein
MGTGTAVKPAVGVFDQIHWGAHLCQLYDSSQDVIDVLVPYFRKGLEENALCLWLAPMPLRQQVMEALREAIPDLEEYQRRGQIQAIPHTDWYFLDGRFSVSTAIGSAAGALSQARQLGLKGIWVAGDTSWLDKKDWPVMVGYEETLSNLMADVPTVGLCAYPTRAMGIPEALDVFRIHRSILVRREGRWEVAESLGQAMAEEALRDSERIYKNLFDSTLNGVVVVDAETGKVVVANAAVARIFGFESPEEVVGVNPLDLMTEDRERVGRLLAEGLLGREMKEAVEFRAVKLDGSEVWISAAGVRTEFQGRRAGLVSIRDITEQRRAEIALQESQRQLQSIFDSTGDGIVVLDTVGRVTAANRRIRDVGGWTLEDIIGKPFDEMAMFRPEDIEKMVNIFVPVISGKASPVMEVKCATKSGGKLDLEIRVSSLKKDNEVIGIIAVLRDITERRRAEEGLRVSEQKNRLLVENVNEGIVVVQDDRVAFANRKTLEIMERLGYSIEDFKSVPLEAFIHPEDRQTFRETNEKWAAGEDLHGLHQFRGLAKNGQTRWIEINAVRLTWDERPAALVFLEDVTSRKDAERALVESEKRYRLLAENVSDVIWVTDLDLRPTYISPSIKGLVGSGKKEPMFTRLEDALTPASAMKVRNLLAELLATGKDHLDTGHPVELEILRSDGSTVWVDTTAAVIRDEAGRPVELLGVLRNITQRKYAEERLQESFQKLEKTLAGTIQAIRAMVDTRDRYTSGHQQRVTELACAIAEVMGLTKEQIQAVHVAGQLHDVGKITLPTEILTKPGRLNEIEFAMIRTHPKAGFDILESIDFPWPIAKMVLQHHERQNGSGYPGGLRADDILTEAKIIAVADVVEAMSSHRPYRPALGLDKALDEIEQNRETLYDPEVTDACMSVFRDGKFTFKDEPAAPQH